MQIEKIINRPFPLASASIEKGVSAFAFGSFVFLFLLVFKPFGLNGVGTKIWMVSFGYGAVTTASMLTMHFALRALLPKFYKETRWTVGREVANTLGVIFLVTLGNVIYSEQMGFFQLSFQTLIVFLGFTLAVGVFPISIQVLIRQNRLQKQYGSGSETINSGIEQKQIKKTTRSLRLKDEEGKEALACDADDLVAFESADNYVKIYYTTADGVKMAMVRNALSDFETQLASDVPIFRTHRTYLVNLDKIDHVTGNARGYLVELAGMKIQIPVARRRIDAFDRAMASR
jgi:hypothetical protein